MKTLKIVLLIALLSVAPGLTSQSVAENFGSSLRNGNQLSERSNAPDFPEVEVSPTLRPRSYPMQAPTIPHDIKGFRITKDFNQCLGCHSRKTAPLMKIPAVAVSHYKNREGDYLSDVSPRRYFCNQCHVPQLKVNPLVTNTFREMEQVSN